MIRLMRLDKPIGIYLLWFPMAWALVSTDASLALWMWFSLGCIVMRSAGCVINDIADRRFDIHVHRTKSRPLTNGEISLSVSFLILIICLCFALLILIQLPAKCFYAAIPAAILSLSYPFFKRFFATPQLILSLAFASSIPMVYIATQHSFDMSFYTLLSITLLWVVCYDSEYALNDLEDDLKLGLFSTARFFGRHAIQIILSFGLILHVLWLMLLDTPLAICLWGLGFMFWFLQYQRLKQAQFFLAFLEHRYYGLWMLCCISIKYLH